MSCSIRLAALDHLKDQGILTEDRQLNVTVTEFENANKQLSKYAYDRYGVSNGKLPFFSLKTYTKTYPFGGGSFTITRAEPEDRLFNILQDAMDNDPELFPYLPPFDINKLNDLVDENEPERFFLLEDKNDVPLVDSIEDVIRHTLFQKSTGTSFPSADVISNILDNYKGLTNETTALLEKLQVLMTSSGTSVKIVPQRDLKKANAISAYNANKNEILIAQERLGTANLDTMVHAVLHEIVHAVTIKSYKSPTTFEHKLFVDVINEGFTKFKESADSSNSYGFTNPIEFIAELMSNPNFQQEVRALDKGSKKKNWWSTFVDAVRTLLGVKKSPTYNEVVEAITSIMSDDNTNLEGIFYKEAEEETNIYSEFKTTEDKLDHTLVRIKESLDLNLRAYRRMSRWEADETKKEAIESYISTLVQLQKDIDEYTTTSKLKAVLIFTENMSDSLSYIKTRLSGVNIEDEEAMKNAVRVYKNYLSTYSVIENIEDLITSLETDATAEELQGVDLSKVDEVVTAARGVYTSANKKIANLTKKAMAYRLNDVKYFPQVEIKHRDRLAKEHEDSQIPTDKEEWIIEKMLTRDKDLILDDVKDYIDALMANPIADIDGTNVLWNSSVNTSSTFVQLMTQILTELDNKRIETERIKDQEFLKAFEALVAEKGTSNINTLYKNLIEYDSNGKPFLKGEHKVAFFEQVSQKIRNLHKEYETKVETQRENIKLAQVKYGEVSQESIDAQKVLANILKEKKNKIKVLKESNMTLDKKGKPLSINSKWNNNLSTLSKAEKRVLDLFTEVAMTSNKATYQQDSLVNYSYGTKFIEFPKITKNDVERLWTGNVKGIVKDKWDEINQTRPDDIGYISRKTDLSNNQLYELKVHYRDPSNEFKNSQQSLDLMTIFRLEYKNGNMYSIRKKAEMDLTFLLDIAKNKTYYESQGTSQVLNWRNKKLNTVSGKETNTAKMMTNMLESRFYDIMHETGAKMAGKDLNKVVGLINGVNAFLTLSLNIASGTANVVNANAQLFLEGFLKGQTISASSIAKANKIYALNMVDNVKDAGRSINVSYVNQLNEMFNIRGLFNLSDVNFLQNDLIKAGLQSNSLQVFQETGEHWMQSVVSMAVLDGVKVLNKNGKFINKDGKVVKTKKEAASVLDMITMNQDTGIIEVSPHLVYTTHSRLSNFQEGGKEKIDLLIRKKLYDSMGNYTQTDQPEIMRHWWGKLVMLYRKYLIPMGVARGKGILSSLKRKEDLTEYERNFSYALQEYEEGTYVSLIRLVSTAIKDKKVALLASNWKSLSDYEKHNIKRAVVEIIMSYVLLPIAVKFVSKLAADEDDEELFFLAYQLRRLKTELSQYMSIAESYKILRSPIPSARLLETAGSMFFGVFSPSTYTEEYQQGRFKGENKVKIKLMKQLPVFKEILRDYEDLLNYQENMFGKGL